MLKHRAPGDVVTVTRIDRLARRTFDLFAIVNQIVDAEGQYRSLAEPWADTALNAILSEPSPPRAGAGRRSPAGHEPESEIDRGTAERGPPPTCGGSYPRGTRSQLRCRQEHDFATVMAFWISIAVTVASVVISSVWTKKRFQSGLPCWFSA